MQADPGTWSDDERAEHGIVALPAKQGEQEAALRESRVADALGPEVLGAFLAVRRSDAAAATGMEIDDVLAGAALPVLSHHGGGGRARPPPP